MTSVQEQLNEIGARLVPTPERVATAKAWLAETKLAHGLDVSPDGAGREFAAAQGVPDRTREDPQDPAIQKHLVEWWEWVLALRAAIHDFHRLGFLVPIVSYDRKQRPTDLDGFFDMECPQIPLGQPGEKNRPTPFPAIVLYKGYAPSVMEAAEHAQRLELYDSDLYANRAELAAFGDRARRCVEEALVCYRADLFLAAGNMLGAASEAAWYEAAEKMRAQGVAGASLQAELAKSFPNISTVQQSVLDDLGQLSAGDFRSKFGMPRGVLSSLGAEARYWREVRNYGMHPAGALGPESFTQASIGLQLQGATSYFEKLAAILRNL